MENGTSSPQFLTQHAPQLRVEITRSVVPVSCVVCGNKNLSAKYTCASVESLVKLLNCN